MLGNAPSRSTGRFETLQPASMPPVSSTRAKSRIIASFGLDSGGVRKSEHSVGGMARGGGKRFHRKRAREMIRAIRNEQKEKARQVLPLQCYSESPVRVRDEAGSAVRRSGSSAENLLAGQRAYLNTTNSKTSLSTVGARRSTGSLGTVDERNQPGMGSG